MNNRIVRELWGTDEQYYKELELFSEKHENASTIVIHNEWGCPIKAEYYFTPYTVVVDHFALLKSLQESNEKANKEPEQS